MEENNNRNEQRENNEKKSNFIFIGLCVLGVGIGLFTHNVASGAVIGAGLGFIAKALMFND